ncbi:MAG: DUF4157 domain-containing protein [Acidimicrobiaceae bacterium]|jgi:hypothetical protein|nr:DUF4157 domain-containing protein [Acidimicrobiaceae bacterium]
MYSRLGDRQNDAGLQSSKAEAVERPAPAVTRLQPVVQAKLSVGPADDVYEREADAIADRVVRSLAAPPVMSSDVVSAGAYGSRIRRSALPVSNITKIAPGVGRIRRFATVDNSSGPQPTARVQRSTTTPGRATVDNSSGPQPIARVQRAAAPHAPSASSGPVGGRTIERMERSFGADFSDIRFRTESSFSGPLDPLAKVQRNTVSLAPSVTPDSNLGLAVIGHELAHITQRTQGSRTGGTDVHRENDANRRGTLAARGLTAGPARVGGSDADQPEYLAPLVVFFGWVAADMAIDKAGEVAFERLQAEFDQAVSTKVNEINSEVRAKFEETSPTGVFLIERGVAHVQTYQKVKAELAILGSIGDEVADKMMLRIIAEQMKEGGNGTPNDAELRIFMGLLKEGSVGAVKIAEVVARTVFTKMVADYVDVVDGAEQVIATGAQWVLGKADLAEEMAAYADAGSAVKSRMSMMKFAYKRLTGKDTFGDKLVQGAEMAREKATQVEGMTAEARTNIDKVKELLVDDDATVAERVTAKSLGNLKAAAASAGLGAVAAAKIAFDKARREGLSTQETLDAAHAAGGQAFMIEMLGAALSEGGRMFIFRGVVYMIPGAGAAAEVIADVSSAMFKVVYDVYGDTLRGHTQWALSNVPALVQAGIDTAAARVSSVSTSIQSSIQSGVESVNATVESGVSAASWAAQYLTDIASWSIANPIDALCLGIKNTAVGIVESPKYATKAVESGAKAVTSGAYSAYEGASEGLSSAYDGAAQGISNAYEGVSSGLSSVQQGASQTIETTKVVANQAWALKGEVPKMAYDAVCKMGIDKAITKGAFYASKLALVGVPGVNYAFLIAEAVAKFCVKHPELAWFAYDYVSAVCEVTALPSKARDILMMVFLQEADINLDDRPEEQVEATPEPTTVMVPQERMYWGTAFTGSDILFGRTPYSEFGGCFSPALGASRFAFSQMGLPPSVVSRFDGLSQVAEELDDELDGVMTPALEEVGPEEQPSSSPLSGLDGYHVSRIQALASNMASGSSVMENVLRSLDSIGDPMPQVQPLPTMTLGTINGLGPMNRGMLGLTSVGLTAWMLRNVTQIGDRE